MNPSATLRFRRATAAIAVFWALFGLGAQAVTLLLSPARPHLPVGPSVVGGVAMIQWRSETAGRAGVDVGDQLLAVDGQPFHIWARQGLRELRSGQRNAYLVEKRDGTRLSAVLPLERPMGSPPPSLLALQLALVVVGCIYLAVGVGVWRLRSDRAESWALLLFCSVAAAQVWSSFGMHTSGWHSTRSLMNLPLIGATVFHLFTTYPIEPAWVVRHRRFRVIPYVVAFGLAGLVLLEGTAIPVGTIGTLPVIFTAAISVFCLAFLMIERRNLTDGALRDRTDVMIFGAALSFLPVMLIFLSQFYFQTSFPLYLALLWYAIFPIAVGYGIVRKQLFEVRVVARSSFVYGAATLAITGLYAFLITYAQSTATQLPINARSPWFSVTFLFLAILAFNPLRNRLQDFVDRFFDRDRAAYRRAVREISEAMVSMLSTKEIVERMLVALSDTMGVERATVLMLDEQERTLRPAASRGHWEEDSEYSEISADHPIWKQLWMRREELSRGDFDDEPDAEVREACRDVFDSLEIELLVPILFGVDLLGVIAVGRKLIGERLTSDDRQLLRTLANQSAIAIENAKAYDEIAKLNESLETRVEERTHELQETQAQLVQSEKMASLGQLVAGVAHELNNPIGFVHANLQLLDEYIRKLVDAERQGQDSERPRQAIDKLLQRSREGTERVKKIVEDLRTFSRMDQAELQEVDVHEEIDRTLSLMEPRLKEGITVERRYGELPHVKCFAGQLNQVFMNLLMNACDAVGRGGRVVITTRPEAGGVRLEFTDDGPGIPEEIRSRIFDPFFTTKPVGKGTGLGLSISHGIIERHGGRIEVHSESGDGTSFVIHLPHDATPLDG